VGPMRRARLPVMLPRMADAPAHRRDLAVKLALAAVALTAVAAVVIWDPILSLARSLDLPGSISLPDVPDLPNWLMLLLGKGKYILLAVIVAMVARGHARRERS
jgi:hypothetical protein